MAYLPQIHHQTHAGHHFLYSVPTFANLPKSAKFSFSEGVWVL